MKQDFKATYSGPGWASKDQDIALIFKLIEALQAEAQEGRAENSRKLARRWGAVRDILHELDQAIRETATKLPIQEMRPALQKLHTISRQIPPNDEDSFHNIFSALRCDIKVLLQSMAAVNERRESSGTARG